jgi:endoglucanase
VKLNPSITFLDLNTEQQAFLEKLLSTPSPTGFEEAGQQIWINEVKDLADDIVTDPYGSAAARIIIDKNKPTIILEAHCDEIGMMINHITEKGFLHVTRLGGSDATIARAKRVHIHTKNGIVLGVVGNTAIHLKDSSNNKQPKWKELFIDIGVSSKEEALELVKVGNPVTYADDLEFLNEDIVVGRAIDNRIGGYIIAEAFKILAEKRDQLNVNVAVVNSVQEEIGGFGARMMTQRLNPNFALVTDVTHATDSPGINHAEHGLVKLGKGAAITHGAANHPKFVQFIEEVADKKDIAIQHEATSVRTGTDTDSIYHQNGGIVSALISLPQRYMHSPSEMVSLTDVKSVTDLMINTVLAMENGQSFNILSID